MKTMNQSEASARFGLDIAIARYGSAMADAGFRDGYRIKSGDDEALIEKSRQKWITAADRLVDLKNALRDFERVISARQRTSAKPQKSKKRRA